MLIYMLLAEGFEESEAIVSAGLLRRAGAEVLLVSLTEEKMVKSARDFTVCADINIDEVKKDEMSCLILPGGADGARRIDANIKARELIEFAARSGVYIGAICAAPFILGRLGLLDGRKVACYPSFKDFIPYGIFTGKKVERDDIFVTAEGMGVSIEFGLALIELLFGQEKAAQIKEQIRS